MAARNRIEWPSPLGRAARQLVFADATEPRESDARDCVLADVG